jgi:HK97 gp10 family phage protein
MVNEVKITVTGLDTLVKRLHDFGPAIERRGLSGAVYRGADVVRKAAKATTKWKDVTGLLRSNIIVAKRRAPPHTATYRVTVRWLRYRNNKTNRLRGNAGKLLERNPRLYGAFLEYGTSKMQARPYLRPAFYGNIDRAIAAMRVGLQEAVQDQVRGWGATIK